MEEGGSNVVDVSLEDKGTSFLFVVPDSDIALIPSGDEEGEVGMKVDATDWIFMVLSDEMDTSNLAIRIFML